MSKHSEIKGLQEALESRLKVLKTKKMHVVVGLLKNKRQQRKESDAPSNAQIAAFHEFGTETIASRPFILPTFEENKAAAIKFLAKFFRASISEASDAPMARGLALVGQKLKDEMFKKVTQGPPLEPALSPATVARKKSSRPLVDTGQMVRAISYEVREK